jgi:hypothetical protein
MPAPARNATVLIEPAEMRNSLLNDTTTDTHATHKGLPFFDVGEIGLFRVDSGAARTTQIGPKPVSPAGVPRAAPPAVIPAAALMASGIKPVICACGDGAEPGAGSSEAARCSAAGVPSSMSGAASVMAAA